LACLNSKVKKYNKGDFIFIEGDFIDSIGIILEGNIKIIREDYFGNKNIIANLFQGDLFGEAFAFSNTNSIPVSVECSTDCIILFLDSNRIISPCEKTCSFHNSLIFNLVHIIAIKNIKLNNKINLLTKPTTRDKVMEFLYSESKKQGSNEIIINFNRQEMADFLSVNRSALSNELSKLKKEQIIDFSKNKFILY